MKLPEMAENKKVDLGLLEEDDEFEEFPLESKSRKNWGTDAQAQEEDVSVWEDNWEDDIVQDDFNQKLKIQLEKIKERNME